MARSIGRTHGLVSKPRFSAIYTGFCDSRENFETRSYPGKQWFLLKAVFVNSK